MTCVTPEGYYLYTRDGQCFLQHPQYGYLGQGIYDNQVCNIGQNNFVCAEYNYPLGYGVNPYMVNAQGIYPYGYRRSYNPGTVNEAGNFGNVYPGVPNPYAEGLGTLGNVYPGVNTGNVYPGVNTGNVYPGLAAAENFGNVYPGVPNPYLGM